MTVELQGSDPRWVAEASREDLFVALQEAACAQRIVDAAMTSCRAELRRRQTEPGCGRHAADEMEVRRRTGESTAASRRQQRRAELAARYRAAASSLQAGRIGGEHLDAVHTVVPNELADAVEAGQEEIFGAAAAQTPDEFRQTLRGWVSDVEHQRGIDRAEQQRMRRHGRLRTDPRTGMTEIHAELAPLQGVPAAVRLRAEYRRLLAEDQAAGDSPRTGTQRWADAVVHLLLAGGAGGPADDRLPVVVVDGDVLAGIGAGPDGSSAGDALDPAAAAPASAAPSTAASGRGGSGAAAPGGRRGRCCILGGDEVPVEIRDLRPSRVRRAVRRLPHPPHPTVGRHPDHKADRPDPGVHGRSPHAARGWMAARPRRRLDRSVDRSHRPDPRPPPEAGVTGR